MAIQAFDLVTIRQGDPYSSHTKGQSKLLYCYHYTDSQNKIQGYKNIKMCTFNIW